MIQRILTLSFALCAALSPMAQTEQASQRCATPAHFSPWLSTYLDNPQNHSGARGAEEIIYLPLAIHTVADNQGEGHYPITKIFESICQLNEDFEPYNIQFYLDGDINRINRSIYYDHDNFSDGFKMMQSNKKSLAINAFIVNSAPSNACGYWHPSSDAIAVIKNCMGKSGHTLTHEVGHWLSLPHPFFGWEGKTYDGGLETPLFHSVNGNDTLFIESVGGENCDRAADKFCDTPPDYLSVGWSCNSDNLSATILTDPNGQTFRSDGKNYMSYSSDACQSQFSPHQVEAMRAYADFAKGFYVNKDPLIQPVFSDPVVQVYPTPGEQIHYENVELEWEHHVNATNYLVQISRFSFFASVDYEFLVESNVAVVGSLPVDKNYFWRVKPYNPFDICTDFTDMGGFSTYDITDIEEIAPSNFVEIYPTYVTAAHPQINLSFTFRDVLRTRLDMYNSAGQMVQADILPNPGHSLHKLRLDGLSAGMYFLKVSTEKGVLVKKISVQ
ncbi:MAG: zinc-dependent metalloprotease [Saprospiraceae bacterium]|nr:zinc-dependent metalloprotease [Saprospiraceae bacterium]